MVTLQLCWLLLVKTFSQKSFTVIHWHRPEHRFSCLSSSHSAVSSVSEHQKLPSDDKPGNRWWDALAGQRVSCHVEVTDTLVYLFWMHSCRSPHETPFLPSKITLKGSIDQNNSEKVKAILQSGALEEDSSEHLHLCSGPAVLCFCFLLPSALQVEVMLMRFSTNIRRFVPDIASHVGGEGARDELVLFSSLQIT